MTSNPTRLYCASETWNFLNHFAILRSEKLEQNLKLRDTMAKMDIRAKVLGGMIGSAIVYNPKSFEECLNCAVLNGGDRDTMGAMACAISGAFLGIDGIPPSWIDKLENREYIEELASKLFETMKGIK